MRQDADSVSEVASKSETPDRITEVETLALEEARRSVDLQRAAVDEVRSRTAILLAASAIVISFLGAQALRQAGWSILAGSAVLAFIVTLALGAGILWPVKGGWSFRADARVILEDFADADPPPEVSARRHLALSLQAASDRNTVRLERLYLRFQLACAGLGLQVVLWAILLADSNA